MAKLGWIVAAALAALLVVGAAAPVDDSKTLEEIKALLTENNRLQRIYVHPRTYKQHPLFAICDFGDKCKAFESVGSRHAMEESLNERHHQITEACVSVDACKKVEADWQQKLSSRKK